MISKSKYFFFNVIEHLSCSLLLVKDDLKSKSAPGFSKGVKKKETCVTNREKNEKEKRKKEQTFLESQASY